MKTKTETSRRNFFWKAGAVLSAPLAVASINASADITDDSEALKSQLMDIDDIKQIQTLQKNYAKYLNTNAPEEFSNLFIDSSAKQLEGNVRKLTPSHFEEKDSIELSANRQRANSVVHYIAELETPLLDCPLVQMAKQQGDGFIKHSENLILENTYVKQDNVWKIEQSTYRVV